MPTFLLTWNPKKYDWEDFSDEIAAVQQFGFTKRRWSCGNNQRIESGDRVFMLRQGSEEPGLVGSGFVIRGSHAAKHWDAFKRPDAMATYVIASWDTLSEQPLVPREQLLSPKFDNSCWNTQSSGIRIPPSLADELELQWSRVINAALPRLPDEIERMAYYEGSVRQIHVNAYERNPYARAACIAHYGSRCIVCGFDASSVYGPEAAGLIHVHHLLALSSIGKTYRVDPIKDLRPVCPNCHALIHLHEPAFSIDAVQAMLKHKRDAVPPASSPS